MILIKWNKRRYKSSGYPLDPGRTTKIRGITITNTSEEVVLIDTKDTPHRKSGK